MKRIFTRIKLYITTICQNLIVDPHLSENLQIRPENTIISYPYILKSICVSLLIFHTVLAIGLDIVCMNFHLLELKTKEIMQNRQKEVEKRKTYILLKIYHKLGAPGARTPYITKSISSQIRNPNLYSKNISS